MEDTNDDAEGQPGSEGAPSGADPASAGNEKAAPTLPGLLRAEIAGAASALQALRTQIVTPNAHPSVETVESLTQATDKVESASRLARLAGDQLLSLEERLLTSTEELRELEKELAAKTVSPTPSTQNTAIDIQPVLQQLDEMSRVLNTMSKDLPRAEAEMVVTPSVSIADIPAEARQRLAIMCDRLNLSMSDAIDRCVATQFYLDQRAREGWALVMQRGRERRQVVIQYPNGGIAPEVGVKRGRRS